MEGSIVFVASHPMSVVAFLLPHIRTLKRHASVQVFSNSNESTLLEKYGVDVPVEFVPIERPIALWSDVKALWILYLKFKTSRPAAVHTMTPKAGLLGMLAAFLARVPVRVHSFTGQVWVTHEGFLRQLLRTADRAIAAMATDVLVDSPSQRDFLIAQNVLNPRCAFVLGAGSMCGVDTQRFSPNKNVRKDVRNEMGTSTDATVCLYLGRLNASKGVLDLAQAFNQISRQHPKAELWVVGPDEGDYFPQMVAFMSRVMRQVKRVDFTPSPERFMQAADLLCLPSYREGFGSAVIEAAACGVPALTSRIYGLTDALVEGQTGWMFAAGDTRELAQQLNRLLAQPAELSSKGKSARQYVETHFQETIVTGAMRDFYEVRLSQVLKKNR
ncbi:glycosyltransferase [Litorivicinus sp.]|nr:glycosyltransferase [Litorivicinus sp.]